MFKQFIENSADFNGYLITSLGIFLLFFIIVSIMLTRMKKEDINYLSDLPLNDENPKQPSE